MLHVLALLGPMEWVIIALIVVLFFGAAKIPDLARALGRAKGEFEKGAREHREDSSKTIENAEEQRILEAAKRLGVPTEGRALADIKADVRAKMS